MRRDARLRRDAESKAAAEAIRGYALTEARREYDRLVALFPELTQPTGVTMQALADATTEVGRHAVRHWRKTAGRRKPKPAPKAALKAALVKASSNGHAPGSLRTLVRQALAGGAKTGVDLRHYIEASGYQHSGKTPLNTRIPQEARHLVQTGEARRTKRGWSWKGGEQG